MIIHIAIVVLLAVVAGYIGQKVGEIEENPRYDKNRNIFTAVLFLIGIAFFAAGDVGVLVGVVFSAGTFGYYQGLLR
jgi:hypothetical protein